MDAKQFELLEKIGDGAYSRVYKAYVLMMIILSINNIIYHYARFFEIKLQFDLKISLTIKLNQIFSSLLKNIIFKMVILIW